jgi:hypothetical protein
MQDSLILDPKSKKPDCDEFNAVGTTLHVGLVYLPIAVTLDAQDVSTTSVREDY